MGKINIGLIGYGTVGSGVAKLLSQRKKYFKDKFGVEFVLKCVCDRSIHKKDTRCLGKAKVVKRFEDILEDDTIHVVVELIGGMHPAKEIVVAALKRGKHVVTANKELIANCGVALFALAKKQGCYLFFESSVGAGIPIIKTITQGVAGNIFNGLYGIINGTCNFILDQMTRCHCSFDAALKEAKEKGYAESDPTLDINGMDSAHKLAILVQLAFGKDIKVKDIYTEGITQISHADIEYATSLDLVIKLLAIAKKTGNQIEVRVHPTLISRDHPLASINSIYNALYLNADPLGDVLLSGEGAGQMAAASGVISDLINLASLRGRRDADKNKESASQYGAALKIRKIDQIQTKFYIRFMATDKPSVLSKIAGVLGKHGISINSVTQRAHNVVSSSTVPLVMLTDFASESMLRKALGEIQKLSTVKSKPVAIRMEKL